MTQHDSEHSGEEADDLPLKMRAALRDAFRSKAPIDAEVDRAILAQAGEHLDKNLSKREAIQVTKDTGVSRKTWLSLAVVAAALLLVANLTIFRGNSDQPGPTPLAIVRSSNGELAREDLDGNGRVDILDAFLLARKLEEGIANDAWDLNQDGKVDQVDVQHAAMLAVRLQTSSTKG